MSTTNANKAEVSSLLTLSQHLQELRNRLFWVAIFFVAASAAAYPYFQAIVDILVRPLGDNKLYYMTPTGELSFIIKVCMYVGLVASLPALIYHLYCFIAPAIKTQGIRTILAYTISSIILAASGLIFAYFISLPAALHFLTGFTVSQISPMLTIDSYMSFVAAYMVAGALLFQVPLVMLIVNSVMSMPMGKLMTGQRYIVVGAFVAAAVISPTPDVVNQAMLAVPIVLMYQLGIVLVWIAQRPKKSRSSKHRHTAQKPSAEVEQAIKPVVPLPIVPQVQEVASVAVQAASHPRPVPSVVEPKTEPLEYRTYRDSPLRVPGRTNTSNRRRLVQ